MTTSDGIIIVAKPQGITSHDVVAKARKALKTKKIGHAGTLDPMATGVPVLGVNKATRLLGHLALTDKVYTTTVRFGATSTTDDADGEITITKNATNIPLRDLTEAVAKFQGEIEQVPSTVSAIKVDGKRAYELARQGETVELKARTVTIEEIDILHAKANDTFLDVELEVTCSTGTYIRALARDLGQELNVGALLIKLRRDRVGPFELKNATTIEDITAEHIIDMKSVAERCFPTWHVTAAHVQDMKHGKPITAPTELQQGTIAAITDDELVALIDTTKSPPQYLAVFA